jgi:PRTRC genetic system protein C
MFTGNRGICVPTDLDESSPSKEPKREKKEEFPQSMTIENLEREFRYDNLRLPDPNRRLSIDEVRTAFSATYPEIATASVTGPEAVGNKLVYYFTKAIGTKG